MKSTVHPNRKGSSSLRTTIPEAVVEFLGVKKGESIIWSFERIDGEVLIVVSAEER